MIKVYGIRNCDTMKKAFAWLDEQGVAYEFQDYKRDPIPKARLAKWAGQVGWRTLLNTQGLTWRRLPEEARAEVDHHKAVDLMAAHPTLIRRPLVVTGEHLVVGFAPAVFASFLKS